MWNLFTLQSYVQQFLAARYMILAQLKQLKKKGYTDNNCLE